MCASVANHHLDVLERGLSAGALLRDPALLERYAAPARGVRGNPAFVVRPATTEEVATVMRWARSHGGTLILQGANTGLVGASTPSAAGDQGVLSLERLNRIRSVDPVDRVAVAEAGVLLDALRTALMPHLLEFPVGLSANASVGGLVATNAGGTHTVRFGDVRRQTLGLEVVLADGTLVTDLRGLRKDNSRINPRELFVGSNGTLGVVTAAALELVVQPRRRVTALLVPHDALSAVHALVAFERHFGPALTAFEVMSSTAVSAAIEHIPSVANPFPATIPALSILVEIADHRHDGVLDEEVAAALEVIDRHPRVQLTDGFVTPPSVAWGLRHALTEGFTHGHDAVLGFDVSVPRSALPTLWQRSRKVVSRIAPHAVCARFGHWGDGGVHLLVGWPRHVPAPSRSIHDDLRDAVYEVVGGLAGSFSAEHGVGPANQRWQDRLVPAPQRHIAAALKGVLDPDHILGHPSTATELT